MGFDLVIFDNDGVLVDSEWHANGILAALLTEFGLPCTREQSVADYLGTTMASVRERVERVLDRIRTPTCVASSSTHERIRLALTTTGLYDRFAGRVFSAQDVAHGKPEPDLFLHAAATLGVRPERCAVIEDSPLGVEAANRAGMTAFGFARMTPAARLQEARGGVFAAMDELPALLNG
jgi:HAD superfamily hydrolase (TIGR01509 family)